MAGAGCAVRAREIAPLAVRVGRVPDPGLRADEAITGFDFAADDSGALHFVWAAMRSDSAGKPNLRTEVWYRRTEPGGTRWDPPVLLGVAWGAGPRLVIVGTNVHVLCGSLLRHWMSGDLGRRWTELPALREGPRVGIGAFDVQSLGDDSLVVACIGTSCHGADEGAEEFVQTLEVLTCLQGRIASSRSLVQAPGLADFASAPRIALIGGRVHVLAGLTGQYKHRETKHGRSVEYWRSRARLFDAVGDRGAAGEWAAARELPLPPGQAESIGDLAVLTRVEHPALFFCSYSVYVTEADDKGAWSRSTRLTPGEQPFLGSYQSSSVGVARAGARTRLVWIDRRFQKSDRSLLNPLGGIPWSDSPEWANNDVFTLDLPDHLDSLTVSRLPGPERLTQSLSRAERVVIRAVGERFCVAWSGREKVGHGVGTYGARPQIFFGYLP